MPSDNEPLAHLYQQWIHGCEVDGAIGQALAKGTLIASWRCDQTPQPVSTMRFRGVKTEFRDRGLKLAHINDAARGVGTDIKLPQQIAIRFLRTLSPFNVFLFPSGRCCEFRLISSATGWLPKTTDWAEDPELRQIALAWLVEAQGKPVVDAQQDFRSEIKPSPDWIRMAEGTLVEVRPKWRDSRNLRIRPNPKPSIRSTKPIAHAFPRVPKKLAVTVSEAVEMLRAWRRSHPRASQLNGRIGNDPRHWLHIRIEGYSDKERFSSRYGPTFRGENYNGVANFHGDTTIVAVDRFIELVDVAEDYRDVLRPSATYETTAKSEKNRVKPKFALQGYQDRVEGFFLYHDES
jgi:hypothetical protein